LGIKTRALALVEAVVASEAGARLAAGLLSGAMGFFRPREKVALQNLGLAFPERSEGERACLLDRFYRHFAWSIVECLALGRKPEEVLSWFPRASGKERLDALVAEGRGAVLLTAHMGSWEIFAAWLVRSGYPLAAVVRDPDDPEEAELLESRRRRFGLRTFGKDVPMTRAVSYLRKGGFLGILADQHGGPEGRPAPFFGEVTSTAVGPGALALLAGVPLVPVWSFRLSPFRHEARISDPIPLLSRSSGREAVLVAAAEACNGAIEGMVRTAPEQWFWLHKRFKERGYGVR
jgi:KDO2-lipid IV(A) lauroyltransferase